tara:strand:- start:658 stop:897 length:240 start_codon:yes stop_codon:yes gene_type:complete
MTNAYKTFNDQMQIASKALDAAQHSLSLCLHMMECEPSERSICDYEAAIQSEKKAREEIGNINAAEMHQRSIDAGLCTA